MTYKGHKYNTAKHLKKNFKEDIQMKIQTFLKKLYPYINQ